MNNKVKPETKKQTKLSKDKQTKVKKEDPKKESEKNKKKILIDYLISQGEKVDSRRNLNSLVDMYKNRYNKFIEGLELNPDVPLNLQDIEPLTDYNSEFEEDEEKIEKTNNEILDKLIKDSDEKNKNEEIPYEMNDIEKLIIQFETLKMKLLTMNKTLDKIEDFLNDTKKIIIVS